MKTYLDFLSSLALSFLQISLPVSFSLHGAGNTWNDAAALWSGQSLLLHLYCFAFSSFYRNGSIFLFLCLNPLNTGRKKKKKKKYMTSLTRSKSTDDSCSLDVTLSQSDHMTNEVHWLDIKQKKNKQIGRQKWSSTASSSEKAARSSLHRSAGFFFFRVFSSVICTRVRTETHDLNTRANNLTFQA